MRMRLWLKRILFCFIGLFAIFNMLVLFLAVWTFTHPHEAWAFVEGHFLPNDLKIKWEKLEFRPRHQTMFNWDIEFGVLGLKVSKGSPSLNLPLDEVRLILSAQAFAPGFHVQVHRLAVTATQPLQYQAGPSTDSPKRSFYEVLHGNLNYLTAARRIAVIEKLAVEISDLQILGEDGKPLHIALGAQKPEADQEIVDYKIKIDIKSDPIASQIDSLELNGRIDMGRFKQAEPFLKADLRVIGRDFRVAGPLQLIYSGEAASLDGVVDFRYKLNKRFFSGRPHLHLRLDDHHLQLRMDTDLKGIPGPMAQLKKIRAVINIPQDDGVEWSAAPSSFVVSAPVGLFFVDKNMRPPLEKSCACRIPEELLVKVEGNGWLKAWFEPSRARQALLDGKLSIQGVNNKLFMVAASARLKMFNEGIHHEQIIYEPYIDSEVRIHSYQGLRRYLDAKNVLIPAPFDVLEGTIDIKALGPLVMGHENDRVTTYMTPVELVANLNSKTQKVALTTTTGFKIDRAFKHLEVNMRARINDLQLELPPLDPILGLPRLTRDGRLKLQPPQKPRPSQFKVVVEFDVETAHAAAIRLLSKMAQPYIPLTLKVTRLSGSNDGFVRVEPFKIKYLRRTVRVENVQMDITETKSGDFPIKGRLRVDQTDYRVYIDFAGTTDNPQISLSSEPYLDRDDIISVLLYDRKSDKLVGSDAENSGNVQAAMADRAIGLFGLWAFATTPIRSFSYNAVTKVYSATVQLADGLTAGVGTDWEHAAHLEIRKRVSQRWVLTASWAPSENQREVGQVVLQWEKRF